MAEWLGDTAVDNCHHLAGGQQTTPPVTQHTLRDLFPLRLYANHLKTTTITTSFFKPTKTQESLCNKMLVFTLVVKVICYHLHLSIGK